MKSSKTIRLLSMLLLSTGLLLFSASQALAQTKVSGTVINERTSAPTPAATITIKKHQPLCRS